MRADVAKAVFKAAQLANLLPDMRNTCVGYLLEIGTLVILLLPHGEEIAGFLDTEAEIAKPPDEEELPCLILAVAPLSSLGPLRFWHKTDPLIVADRINPAPRQPSKFPYAETRPK